jgi:hypothetical protein
MRPRRVAPVRLFAISSRQTDGTRAPQSATASKTSRTAFAVLSAKIQARVSPSCRAPDSRATSVPVGLPFCPIEAAESLRLSALANASKSGASLFAAMRGPDGNQAGDFSAVTGDRHFLAPFDEIEQLPELVSCLEGADFPHWLDRVSKTRLAYRVAGAISSSLPSAP